MKIILLLGVLLVGHLRTSRKKGSHNEKSHGTRAGFGADGPKASRAKSSAKGKKITQAKGNKTNNRSTLEGIKATGGIMGLPKGGLGPEANARAREENRKAGFRGAKGGDDPKTMTDEELDYFIQTNEMVLNARTQTPEARQKAAERLAKMWVEKKRRDDRKALGYNY